MGKTKNFLAGLFLFVGMACTGEPGQAPDVPPGVDVSHTDDGGISYTVNPQAFTLNSEYGSVESEGYVIPRTGQIRTGCFLSTPWLPVSHPDGVVLAFPHITLEWWGELHPEQAPEMTLLRLQIDVKKPDGTSNTMNSFVHTDLLTLKRRYDYPDGWSSYYGRMDNPLVSGEDKDFGSIAVSERDEVRYSICDLDAGGKLVIRDLKVLSRPIP